MEHIVDTDLICKTGSARSFSKEILQIFLGILLYLVQTIIIIYNTYAETVRRDKKKRDHVNTATKFEDYRTIR